LTGVRFTPAILAKMLWAEPERKSQIYTAAAGIRRVVAVPDMGGETHG
jgi:hypothetical protein